MSDPLPLPTPRTLSRGNEDGAIQLGYTADQMHAYAAACVAAERERAERAIDDAVRLAKEAEAHYWRSLVERVTAQADNWNARYMALVQQVADGRAMQPSTHIVVDAAAIRALPHDAPPTRA